MISCQCFYRMLLFFAVLQYFSAIVNSAPVLNCTKVDGDCIVKTADKNKDGLVNYEEAYKYFESTFGEKKTRDQIAEKVIKMDINHDGFLSAVEIHPPSELKVIIDRSSLPKVKAGPDSHHRCILNYADKNNDGVLSYEEVLAWVEEFQINMGDNYLAVLKKADLNHDGFLSVSELPAYSYYEPLPKGITLDLYCVTNKADKNYDGVLSFEEGHEYLASLDGNKNKTKDEILAEMKKLDLNQDGVLSASEIFPSTLPKSV